MLFILFLINLIFFSFSDTWINLNNLSGSVLNDIVSCNTGKFYIKWIFDVKRWDYVEYDINNKINVSYYLSLYSWNDVLKKVENSKLWYLFENIGVYKLKASIYENDTECKYKISKDINVYKKIYLYIWLYEPFLDLDIVGNYRKEDILFKKILLYDVVYDTQENFLKFFKDNIYYIKRADNIIINYNNVTSIFDMLVFLNKYYNIDFSSKKIFVIYDGNKNLIKKLLLKYMKLLDIKGVYILDKKYLIDLIVKTKFSDQINQYIQYYTLSFEEVSKLYVMSYFIDLLIFNWFSTNLIWILLLIAFSVVVITIFRQMIGLSVFSVYHPLFFALSLYILWFKFTFVLFIIALVSTFLIRLITKKIYLLYSPKIALLIIIYVLLFFIFIWINVLFDMNLINIKAFSNIIIIFPTLSILFVSNKIVYEWFNIISYKWWLNILEFFIVSFVVYLILSSYYLKFLFLSYPELVFGLFILNILIWRFTGLQLTEYFRFKPLIKKYFEEE